MPGRNLPDALGPQGFSALAGFQGTAIRLETRAREFVPMASLRVFKPEGEGKPILRSPKRAREGVL